MLKICPKLHGQIFEEPPSKEEILSFIRDLGHTGEIKFLSDVNVNHMHQPWRSLAARVNKCLSRKATTLESLHLDDFMFTTVRVISKHQDTQVYHVILPQHLTNQAMLESEAYMTYRAYATCEKTPKQKSTKKKFDSKSSPKMKPTQDFKGTRIKTSAKGDKPVKMKQFVTKSKGLTMLSKAALSEANQIKMETERSKKEFHISYASSSGDGVDILSKVPDEQHKLYMVRMKEMVTNQSEDDNDEHDSANDNDDEDDDQENEKEDEEEKANDDDEVSFDQKVSTPPDYEILDEEDNQEEDDKTPSSETTIPQPPILIIQPQQQTYDSTTTIAIPTTSLPEILNFASLFGFEQRVSSLEFELYELKQTNQFAEAVSSISGIVDNYLGFKMKDVVNVAVQLQSNKLREEAQAKNDEFLKQIDSNIKVIIKDQVKALVSKILPKVEKYVTESLRAELLTRSSNQPQTSYGVAASLSEFELKKILINKIKENKSMHKLDVQKNLYNALIKLYNSNKDIFASYGDVVTLKRGRDDQDKDKEPSAGSNQGTKRRRSGKEELSKEATQKESKTKSFFKGNDDVSPVREVKMLMNDCGINQALNLLIVNGTKRRLLMTTSSIMDDSVGSTSGTQSSFNEFLATPIDFSAFIMNQLKINDLTQDVLTGPTYDLKKGTCKSVVELEYHLKQVFKATNDQLDWHNPKRRPYPHDLSKPLPLIQNARVLQVIPFDHFINNDLEYLKGGSLSKKYTTSITKTKAVDYGHV
nr:hypothetical protein [Tanacetum cinerariifolium]